MMEWQTVIQIPVTSSDFNKSSDIAKGCSNIVFDLSHAYRVNY